jgi:hypothetical protein
LTTITVDEDCGNSPKKTLLRDFNIAFAEKNVEFIRENVSEDIEWTVVGDRQIQGEGRLRDVVRRMASSDVTALTIEHVITHGATGAVNGALTLDGGTEYAFCDVYEFNSHAKDAPIQSFTSYVIET